MNDPVTGSNAGRRPWTAPRLKQLTADLSAVSGNRFAPGDGNSGAGKSAIPPGS